MAFGQLSLKGRALRLLATREHSRQELERKLAPHAETPGQLKTVLDGLQARAFIDEGRVAESLVNRRASKLGAGRIRQELQARGVPPEQVAAAVDALRSSEVERAREVWRKKFGAPATSPAESAKQARFLAGRGFTPESIRLALRGDVES